MKAKAVHIVIDDKFIDGAISLFEIDDRIDNSYIIIGNEQTCKYIKTPSVRFVDNSKALDYINQFDIAVIHSLPSVPIDILIKIDRRIKIVWYAWGYDLYEKPFRLIPVRLLGPATKRATFIDRLKKKMEVSHYRKWALIRQNINSALSRIDFFSGVFPYEIEMLKQYHPEFKASPLDFYYGSNNFFVPETPSTIYKHNKTNIIIGNSADPAGNHLDVLNVISGVSFDSNTKIIIPLSYGGTCKYVNKVVRKAERVAPGQVLCLKDFLPLKDYLELISNCRTAIFAHERQQASDNVFMQLLYGARVYMSEHSAAYDYLKSIGLKVFSIQKEMSLFNIELSDDEVYQNRTILSRMYSTSKLIERIQNINTTLLKEICKNENN